MVSSRTQAPCHRNAVETVCVRTALRTGGNRDTRVTGTDAIISYHFARRCERAARLRRGGPFAKGRPVRCEAASRGMERHGFAAGPARPPPDGRGSLEPRDNVLAGVG